MSTRRERRELYSTGRWRALRDDTLSRDGWLCVVCLREGRTVGAEIVHHIRPVREGGDPWAPGNLESLCRRCHEAAHNTEAPDPWRLFVNELIEQEEAKREKANSVAA